MQKWRLLLSTLTEAPVFFGRAGEAAWNMAVDEALLESQCAGVSPPTLRLYFWKSAAITLGRFQNVARTLNLDEIERERIPLARRITGGRGILHGHDLTVSLTASVAALGLPESVSIGAVYTRIAASYLQGFRSLGISVSQGCSQASIERHRPYGDCFQHTSKADLTDSRTGEKRLGAALHRRGSVILQQVSIPIRLPSCNISPFRGSANRLSFLMDSLNPGSISEAVIEGMTGEFGLQFDAVALTKSEFQRAVRLMQEKYLSQEWTLHGLQNTTDDSVEDEIDS